MPNIFDGLRQISDNNMIEQIALLETMNITNISKPVIQKAKKKTISIINFIGSKFGKNNMIEEPEVKEIWTLIDEKKEELLDCTREQLEERLFEVLREKGTSLDYRGNHRSVYCYSGWTHENDPYRFRPF